MIASLLPSLVLTALLHSGAARNSSSLSGTVSYDIERKSLARDVLGFSIGPLSITEVVKSELTANALSVLANISGANVPIRIGGAASDKVTVQSNLTEPFVVDPEARDLETLFISKDYFQLWNNYFPGNTSFTYTLNFANTENQWGNASLQAQWALESLGDSLRLFEFGDSPDHYIYLAYRNATTWGAQEYTDEFSTLSSVIVNSTFYRNSSHHPAFQAGGFSDPPSIPDQQWENDDLDIINITKAGLDKSGLIEKYSYHLFPEADTPPIRKAQLSLDLLSNHNVVYQNLSQFVDEASAAAAQDSSLILSAAGAVAGGASGISDTFGAALWGVDFVLTAASLGISQTYFHFDGHSPDSPLVPIDYQYRAQNLSKGVRANFYTALFLAHVVNSPYELSVGNIPDFNSTSLSGFALFDDESESGLQKLVFIDLSVYNTTSNLWNSASQSRKNGTYLYSNQTRDGNKLSLSTPWKEGTQLKVVRLQGPGTNARTDVQVAGQSIDPQSGKIIGSLRNETLAVGSNGTLNVPLSLAEAVILEVIPSAVAHNASLNGTFTLPPSHNEAEAADATATSTGKKHRNSKKNQATSSQMSAAGIVLAAVFALIV